MSKVAVVYWSGTGNTEAMANEVAEGAKAKGAEVTTLTASEFSSADLATYVYRLRRKSFRKEDCTFWFIRMGKWRMDG